MENTSRFQIVLLGAFVFFIVIGVLIFANFQSTGNQKSPPITTWGVLPDSLIRPILESPDFLATGVTIIYVEKNPATFDREFVEALAEGRGPDLIIIPQNLLYKEKNKLSPISYDLFPAREFKDTFVQSSEILLENSGILGIPFAIDPLVLYWNRTNFTDAGVTNPPRLWEEVGPLVSKLTSRDQGLNIRKSAIALGAYQNITNAKEIISNLLLQSGNSIIAMDGIGGESAVLNSSGDSVSSALSFYTSFSNATNANYSWNRVLPQSSRAFSDGTLSMYIGFASELPLIRERNPNLNFDVAPLPQIKGASKKNFANLYILSVPRQSRYPLDSYNAARALSGAGPLSTLAQNSVLPPVRRDLLSAPTNDAFRSVFYESALSSAFWADPDPEKSAVIFKDMIEGITSGSESMGSAISVANNELGSLLINRE